MNPLSIKIGFWAALLSALTFVVFTICFVAIALVSPLFTWTNLADYAAYTQANPQFYKALAQLMMLLFGPLFVLLLSAVHDYAPAGQKILSRSSLALGTIFAALASSGYFIQLSIVRHSVAAGTVEGLELLIQANPNAAITAVIMLGFTLFLGLASLLAAPIFSHGRLEKVIRLAFLANGLFCLLGGVGYVLGLTLVVFLTTNLGMGGAVLALTIGLSLRFRQLGRSRPQAQQPPPAGAAV